MYGDNSEEKVMYIEMTVKLTLVSLINFYSQTKVILHKCYFNLIK
jgi:hypothetical protein